MTNDEPQRVDPVERIGTPMSANATRALLLGSGELGRELSLSFQKLGLEVHAVDRYFDAPAHQVSQFQYVADLSDDEQVRSLIRRVRPDCVVPEIETVAWRVLADVEAAGLATVVPTARACELTASREGIRTVASETLGLPTTAYAFATTLEEFRAAFEDLGFPCVAKPAVSSAGRRHVIVEDAEGIEAAWSRVYRPAEGFDEAVIVERFVDFDYEVTIVAVRSIDPTTGELATWFCEPIGCSHRAGVLAEAWQPMRMSEAAHDNARSVAARITNELGGTGAFGVDLFVAGDEVYFSSVSPRPHDAAVVTLGTQRYSQFDLHARAILGLPIDVTLTSPGAAAIITATEVSNNVCYSGLADAFAVPETEVRLFGKPSAYVGRHMGLALSTADTVEEARTRARTAAGCIAIEG